MICYENYENDEIVVLNCGCVVCEEDLESHIDRQLGSLSAQVRCPGNRERCGHLTPSEIH